MFVQGKGALRRELTEPARPAKHHRDTPIEGIYVPSPVVGSYGWRYNDGRSQGPRDWIKTDLDSEEWKALPGGLFDGSVDRARAAFDTMSQAFDDAASRFF